MKNTAISLRVNSASGAPVRAFTSPRTELRLPAREVYSLARDSRGIRVRCRSGVLWLTQEGDGVDYLLKGGDEFTVSHRGRIVIQALEEAQLSLQGRQAAHS